MNKRLIQSLLVLSLLGFSSASSAEPPPPPSIDLSTPEKALRSYWALRGWEGDVFNEKMKLHSANFVDTLPHIQKITTGTANQFFSTLRNSPRDVLDRHIDKISEENDGRVVIFVTIRNVTPIPADAKPTETQLQRRERGQKFEYILVAEGKDWKLAEAWMYGDTLMPDKMLFEILPSSFPSEVWFD